MDDSKLKGRLIAAAVTSVLLLGLSQWMKSEMPDQQSPGEAMNRARMMQMQVEHARRAQDMAQMHRQMSEQQFMQSLDQMSQVGQMNFDYDY